MKFDIIILISVITVILILLALITFLGFMLNQQSKIKKKDYPNCPDIIFNRYKLWYSSFSLWTVIEYVLILIPLFTSVATIYFATDLLSGNNSSAVLLSIMSFISSLLPLVNSKILPKVHANGFYKGAVTLEQGILKHKENLISTKELLEILDNAEKYTNPLAYRDDASRSNDNNLPSDN